MDNDNSRVTQFLIADIKYSLTEFFSDWFFVYPQKILKGLISNFKEFDRSLGLQAMTKNWLNPLYQDYNFWGYVIGIAIRTVYIVVAGVGFFAIYVLISALVLILWYAIPFMIIIFFFRNLFGV